MPKTRQSKRARVSDSEITSLEQLHQSLMEDGTAHPVAHQVEQFLEQSRRELRDLEDRDRRRTGALGDMSVMNQPPTTPWEVGTNTLGNSPRGIPASTNIQVHAQVHADNHQTPIVPVDPGVNHAPRGSGPTPTASIQDESITSVDQEGHYSMNVKLWEKKFHALEYQIGQFEYREVALVAQFQGIQNQLTHKIAELSKHVQHLDRENIDLHRQMEATRAMLNRGSMPCPMPGVSTPIYGQAVEEFTAHSNMTDPDTVPPIHAGVGKSKQSLGVNPQQERSTLNDIGYHPAERGREHFIEGRALGLTYEEGQLRTNGVPLCVPGLNPGVVRPPMTYTDSQVPPSNQAQGGQIIPPAHASPLWPQDDNQIVQSSDHNPTWRRKFKEPLKFDGGDLDFNSWLVHFEAISDYHQWTQREKALQLVTSLKGRATHVLGGLRPVQLHDYDFMTARLRDRFDPAKRETAYKAQLKNRVRAKNESPIQYSDELMRLARKAFPTLTEDAMDQLALDQFMSGHDRKSKKHVLLQGPDTLSDAVTIITRYESVVERSGTNKPVHAVVDTNQDDYFIRKVTEAIGNVLSPVMEKITQSLEVGNTHRGQQLRNKQVRPNQLATNNKRAHPNGKSGEPGKPFDRRPECYACGKKGHFARDCRSKPVYPVETAPSVQSVKSMVFSRRSQGGPPSVSDVGEENY